MTWAPGPENCQRLTLLSLWASLFQEHLAAGKGMSNSPRDGVGTAEEGKGEVRRGNKPPPWAGVSISLKFKCLQR